MSSIYGTMSISGGTMSNGPKVVETEWKHARNLEPNSW